MGNNPKDSYTHSGDHKPITSTTNGAKEALDVNIAGATSSSITEYTEGDTDSTITGVAVLAENALSPDELRPLQVDNSDNLKIDIASQSGTVTVDVNGAVPVTDNGGSLTVDPGAGNWNDATITGLGSTLPVNASLQGYSDGTNIQAARVYDTDTGAGTEYNTRIVTGKQVNGS